jgi:hypothetical protein
MAITTDLIGDQQTGNDAQSASIMVTGSYLKSGWNMIAVPDNCTVAKTDLSIYMNSSEYTWDDAINPSNGPIVDGNIFGWNPLLQIYESVDVLETGKGYWLYAYLDCGVSADSYSFSPNTYPNTICGLMEYWNIIGSSDDETMTMINCSVQYNNQSIPWSNATSSNNPTGSPLVDPNIYGWNQYAQMYVTKTELEAGYGYWMYSYQICDIRGSL